MITHAPTLEAKFVTDGYCLEPRAAQIFYSDYVIVGPSNDPGRRRDQRTRTTRIGAFEDIAAAGTPTRATTRFRLARRQLRDQRAGADHVGPDDDVTTADGDEQRRHRDDPRRSRGPSAGTYPDWYGKTNKGQAPTCQDRGLRRHVPDDGCYTMVDRGTFNRRSTTAP